MTPAEYQKMIDYFDIYQFQGQIPDKSPFSGNAEMEREWQMILLAIEAIQSDAVAEQVRAVRLCPADWGCPSHRSLED
jgi:hypothetical protein